MGFGGWAGLGLSPYFMLFAPTGAMKLLIFLLGAPVGALVFTGTASVFYAVSVGIHYTYSLMINPMFLHAACNTLFFSAISLGFIAFQRRLTELKDISPAAYPYVPHEEEPEVEEEDGDDVSTVSSVDIGDIGNAEEGDSDNNQTDNEDNAADLMRFACDPTGAMAALKNSWKSKANFEALKNAPPVAENDS